MSAMSSIFTFDNTHLCNLRQCLPGDELRHVCIAGVVLELKDPADGPGCGVPHVGVGVLHGLQCKHRGMTRLLDKGCPQI